MRIEEKSDEQDKEEREEMTKCEGKSRRYFSSRFSIFWHSYRFVNVFFYASSIGPSIQFPFYFTDEALSVPTPVIDYYN